MLSIIVPVLNEAAALPALLVQLQHLRHQGCEVLMVDGGSTDTSGALIQAAGLKLVHAPAGRARQMNAGAAQASCQVLLFLHADTELPPGAMDCVFEALGLVASSVSQPDVQSDMQSAPPKGAHRGHHKPMSSLRGEVSIGPHHCWGRFDVHITGQHWMLRPIARLMNLRSRYSGIATGDQAMFMTRAAFEAAGGFPDQPLMEDIELSKRLLQRSRPACVRRCVHTSGRRWETRGVWRTMLLMWRLRWAYWRGVPADVLARAYR